MAADERQELKAIRWLIRIGREVGRGGHEP